jgi:glycosyltransferase involved in cell wall biosynthesis
MPQVSIVLPTYNRTKYLPPAIGSILAQTFPDWELIVADDGSSDETKAYLRGLSDPRMRMIWLPHSGNPGSVRNRAIKAAIGRQLAFLDSDDIWAPQKLERQLNALRERPECRWSYTHCDLIDGDGVGIANQALGRQVRPAGWILEPMLRDLRNQMAMASVVADRQFVDEMGGFDERQRWCEDLDLCLRMAMRSQAATLAEPLCSVRTHGDHHSGDRIEEYESRIAVYAKIADLIADPRLRDVCRRQRAAQSLTLARLRGDDGGVGAVCRTLAIACSFSWSYPDWWFGALKAIGRSLLPEPVLRAYRRWS